MDSKEKKDKALKDFSDVKDKISELEKDRLQLAKELDKLSKEVNKETSYIEASEWFNSLGSEISSLRNVSFSRFERGIIHKHRIDSGLLDSSTRPPTLMPLERELDNLKSYYPSLKKVKASGEDTIIELPGLTITFMSDGTTKVPGDPGVLKAFSEGASTTQSRGRRRRSIQTKGES